MMAFTLFLVFLSCFANVVVPIHSHQLCKEGKDWWYDIQEAKCRPCKSCPAKDFTLEPCSDFVDTLCINISEIGKSIQKNRELGVDNFMQGNYKWHEMEGKDDDRHAQSKTTTADPMPDQTEAIDKAIIYVLCITFIGTTLCIAGIVRKNQKYYAARRNMRILAYRDRLFSRDGLNTTEFMNNLATLDRRLAMDEILEKRKMAYFEPNLLLENMYLDEVFVDVSGFPKAQSQREIAADGEPEHKTWLLKIQEN